MKKPLVSLVALLAATLLLNGCLIAGTGPKTQNYPPTVGQQLVDLKKAKDAGALTEDEYQAQKAKLLEK